MAGAAACLTSGCCRALYPVSARPPSRCLRDAVPVPLRVPGVQPLAFCLPEGTVWRGLVSGGCGTWLWADGQAEGQGRCALARPGTKGTGTQRQPTPSEPPSRVCGALVLSLAARAGRLLLSPTLCSGAGSRARRDIDSELKRRHGPQPNPAA